MKHNETMAVQKKAVDARSCQPYIEVGLRPFLPPSIIRIMACGFSLLDQVRVGDHSGTIVCRTADDIGACACEKVCRVTNEAINSDGHCNLSREGCHPPPSWMDQLKKDGECRGRCQPFHA